MNPALTDQLSAALAQFSGVTRLYALTVGDREMLVEAFAAQEELNEVGAREVIALSTSIHLRPGALLGQAATLQVSLADGTRTSFAGEISAAALVGSDGGFARYRLRISPWTWRLGQCRNSRVWQDKAVVEIVDSVFEAYQPDARWRWSDETGAFLDGVAPRSYCCQYRESDLAFVQRLLAEEGLCWRMEQAGDGPCLVLFADSGRVPEDVSSAADGAIRYHGARSVEQQDTVQALIASRQLHATLATVLSPDYKRKRSIGASAPTHTRFGANVPALESYDVPGQYAFADSATAARYVDLRMQAKEARGERWRGRSTVRTLRAGTRLTVSGAPLRSLGEGARFAIVGVTSVGFNNLPTPAREALAELFGPIPELLEECLPGPVPADFALVVEQARSTGYANCFDAVPADVPWRPMQAGGDERPRARPTAKGAQTAIVLGPDGAVTPNGADELYCDRLARVRIRFHWQDSGDAACWVRVAQRLAGGGMGSQFLPRIGQEVLVQFLEGDIDRPIIVGALYNGQGEGGVALTPGGQVLRPQDGSCFGRAHDHAPSGQGNLAGGHSPVWHGAAPGIGGHGNAAAQWGVRSKEFGGWGYNQLLFDDTDAQGRVQLKSSHAASELNLGHLIHAADNYRGSFRGLGAELRTDAYGAVRAGAGLLVSSYKISHGASRRDPAGENTVCIGMLRQAAALAKQLHGAAVAHQAVGLAASGGTVKAGASRIDKDVPPLEALAAVASVMAEQPEDGTARHPAIAIAARDGLGIVAGQAVQLSSGDAIAIASGQDTQFVSGGQMRVHAGQAIGLVGGALRPGEGGIGLQFIAASGAVNVQAQADVLKVQARDEVNVVSAHAHIDWAAAKRISLSTAGGANITIDGGNIMVQCPGKITVHAGKKSLLEPAQLSYPLPPLPNSICVACLKRSLAAGPAFTKVN